MSIAIKIENLSKQYRLGSVSTRTLSHDLNRWWQMNIRGKEDPFLKIGEISNRATKSESEFVWALRDINIEVQEGEILGIIGKNGAGKSTLLKILSKVTVPTTGSVHARGRIASLLEVGTGFHPEMTGRENIFMNGAILGMSKAEIQNKFDEIVDFSGVETFIDTPVKRYSSGMLVRLGFAVAAHLEPEILIVDEVLAVGDAEFQKKAIGKMQNISMGKGRTVLFVSHNMGAISELCTKCVLFQKGEITDNGDVGKIITTYLQINKYSKGSYYFDGKNKEDKKAFFEEIKVIDNENNIRNTFFFDETINISFRLRINNNDQRLNVFCIILDRKLNRVFSSESSGLKDKMTLKIHPNFLVRGNYSINAFIHIPKIKQEDVVENVCNFRILDNKSKLAKHGEYDYGVVFGNCSWI